MIEMVERIGIKDIRCIRIFNFDSGESMQLEITATVGPGQNPGEIVKSIFNATEVIEEIRSKESK